MDPREKRLAQNEALYREVNERIQDLARRQDASLGGGGGHGYAYFCECANADCNLQIAVPTDVYEWVRAESNRFIVAPGHETPEIEIVIRTEGEYQIVEKQGEAARYVEQLDPRERD